MGGIDRSMNESSGNNIKTGSTSLFNSNQRNEIKCGIYSPCFYLTEQAILRRMQI